MLDRQSTALSQQSLLFGTAESRFCDVVRLHTNSCRNLQAPSARRRQNKFPRPDSCRCTMRLEPRCVYLTMRNHSRRRKTSDLDYWRGGPGGLDTAAPWSSPTFEI